MNKSTNKIISKCIGEKLVQILAGYHVYKDKTDRSFPISLYIKFENQNIFKLIGKYGDQIEIIYENPESINMVEYGKIIIEDIINNSFLKNLFGKTLTQAFDLKFPDSSGSFGIKLRFGNNKNLFIIHWCDEFYINSKFPEKIKKDIKELFHGIEYIEDEIMKD
jgi:hypothetical protein